MSIFKACDIRGVYPDELDEEHAFAVGRALGTELAGRACVLGGDLRRSTPTLKSAVREGLLRSGADVIDLGVVPTPVAYWAQRSLRAHGVVVVTASHNPPRYNGMKFMVGDRPPMPEDVTRLAQRVQTGDFADGSGRASERNVKRQYMDWLRSRFGRAAEGLRVLVDAGNGCASEWAPTALREAGCLVEELFCEPDGTFPNRSPNPSSAEALAEASRQATERGVDLAVAFDGDADRAVFLDEAGTFVDGDKAIIIFARHVLALEPHAAIVYDLKCTRRVPEQVTLAGGRALPEKSGYAFIKSRLLEERAAFAGEASGHFFFRELGGDDGIYAALRMAQVVKASGRPFSGLLASIPPYFITPDIRIPRRAGDGKQTVEHLKKAFADYPLDDTDGVRIEFGNGWALCRVSVTEPVITFRFEGDTPEALEEIKGRVLAQIPD